MKPGDWMPTPSLDALRARARVLQKVRAFFDERGVMEVETPLLSGTTVTDLHLHSVTARLGQVDHDLYLQTSPEFHMKRMLVAGIGPIYQICRAVRDGESGRRHNPEFTILEWYRPGWDHHDLMTEVDDLLASVLGTQEGERLSYVEAFERFAELNPHTAVDGDLRQRVAVLGVRGLEELDRDDLLNLIMTHVVEPRLGRGRPTFISDYPASQAALARVREEDPPVAERFEVYVDGLELANGYHELTDPAEQRRRFERDREARSQAGLPVPPIDERLLAALETGLPSCAGVALGVDRLVMLKLGTRDIADVIAFPIDRA